MLAMLERGKKSGREENESGMGGSCVAKVKKWEIWRGFFGKS